MIFQTLEQLAATLPAGIALGGCLTARGKHAEAEKLLLDAHEIFAERSAASSDARRARQRLVDLYTA